MIDQEFVQYIVNAIVSKPDKVRVERVVDERGVLLTLHVDEEDLGRVIGRKGVLAQSLRVLLRALGSKNEAHYNLRIADGKEGDDAERDAYSGLRREEPAAPADSSEAVSEEVTVEDSVEDGDEDDSLLDKTKKELDQFDDLDI